MKKSPALILLLICLSCATNKTTTGFQKIIFHSSACFGSCPIIALQVNNDKTVLLKKQEMIIPSLVAENNNPAPAEYFKGRVEAKLYDELIREIQSTDSLSLEGQNCCDAPLKTITSYYKGRRKFIKTMFPPKEAQRLIEILYEISKLEGLEKTEKPFLIEDGNK